MADVADLMQRLQEHRDQLAQIDQLLQLTPGDEELIKIKGDLEQVVALTLELSSSSKWKVGDRCTAKWEDGKFYAATITEVKEDDYSVQFLDYGDKATVPESSLESYVPLPVDQLIKGAMVRAISEEDGLFHDAFIVSDDGNDRFIVRFPKFGKKKFSVGAYDVTPRLGKKKASVNADAPLPETVEIPEALRLKATDTEAQRRSKRARVKVMKQQHKKRKLEQEGARKQNNWLAFQKSAKTGYGKKKKSMFATSSKGVVGVIGSGKGMTDNPDLIRNKYTEWEDDNEED